MDEIRFHIAEDIVYEEPALTIEPIVNGKSLRDVMTQLDRSPIGYVGFAPEDLLSRLRAVESGAAVRTMLLRCSCGNPECTSVSADITVAADHVEWTNVSSTWRKAEGKSVASLTFDRPAYEAALADPEHGSQPVRDTSIRPALAKGLPEDHRDWLELLYMETEGDPYLPDNIELMLEGLRAFRDRGDPITESEARSWATDTYMDRPAGIIVGIVLAVNAGT